MLYVCVCVVCVLCVVYLLVHVMLCECVCVVCMCGVVCSCVVCGVFVCVFEISLKIGKFMSHHEGFGIYILQDSIKNSFVLCDKCF